MKKIRYLLMSLMGFFCVTSLHAQNSTVNVDIDGLEYSIPTEGDATLTGGTIPKDGNLVIPKTITYQNRVVRVGHIAAYAFEYNDDITNIDFGNVHTIGYRAFFDCDGIRCLDLAEVDSIGDSAFSYCSYLSKVKIGNKLAEFAVNGVFPRDRYFTLFKPTGSNLSTSWSFLYNEVYDYDFYQDNYFYKFLPESSSSVSLLNEFRTSSETHLVIPLTVQYNGKDYKVAALGNRAFKDKDIVSVDLGNVETIGDSVFYRCRQLDSLDLKNVQTIGSYAFFDCGRVKSSDLKKVKAIGSYAFYDCQLPDSLYFANVDSIGSYAFSCYQVVSALKFIDFGIIKSIGNGAFKNCSQLNRIEFAKVQTIGSNAFYNCDGLKSLDFNNVQTIGALAFYDCDGLKSLDFNNVQTIGAQAFYDCDGLISLDFNDVQTIGAQAFYDCDGLTSLNFNNIQSIGSEAFSRCDRLNSLNFNNVKSISSEAFYYCDGLKFLSFANVQTINSRAFDQCIHLQKVMIDAKSAEVEVNGAFYSNSSFALYKPTASNISKGWSIYSDEVFDYDLYSENYFYKYLPESASSVTLCHEFQPSTVLHLAIPLTAYANGKDYKVAALGNRAFEGKDIVSVDFGNVETIGESAFYQCTQLDSLDFKNVKTIGSDAFYKCESLTYLDFSKVETIGASAFHSCKGLTSLDFKNVKTVGSDAFYNCAGLKNLDFSKVESIGANAFYSCKGLTSLDFKNVKTIGSNAFYDCSSLDSLCFGKVDSIGAFAFSPDNSRYYVSNSLRFIDFGNVKSIGRGAFQYSRHLKNLDFKNVRTIGPSAFYNCISLDSLCLTNVDTIGAYAFSYSTNYSNNESILKSIDFGNVKSIGESAFKYCKHLKHLDFKNVQTIGSDAFYRCDSLEYIDFANVDSIGSNAFYSCDNLRKVKIGAKLAEFDVYGAFYREDDFTLYKPTASKLSSSWSRYADKVFDYDIYSDNYLYKLLPASTPSVSLWYEFRPSSSTHLALPLTAKENGKEYKVTAIGNRAFQERSITSVDFGNVECIGDSAFYQCNHLSNLDFKNVQMIGADAFNSCDSLKTLDFKNVKTIGKKAFYDCKKLVSLDFKNVATIGSYAFAFDTNHFGENELSSISLGKVKVIGTKAFAYSRKLASLDFLHVDSIGYGAFEHCEGVSLIDFRNVKFIDGEAFSNCYKIKTLELDYIEHIGVGAFRDCNNIQKIKVDLMKAPEIEYNTFSSNFNLYIPAGCKGVYEEAGWSGFNYNTFRAKIFEYDFQDQGFCYQITSVPDSTVSLLTFFTPISTDFVVPEKVSFIDRDFNVTELGDDAFAYCDSLTSIDFKNVTTIGASAFHHCRSLTSLDFKNIKTIGNGAFSDCYGLTSLDFKNVSSLGTSAFANCMGIKSVDFKNVKTIGDKAFLKCESLQYLDFQNVEHIGSSAFEYCYALEAADFKGVKYIDSDAFSNCLSLERIKINEMLAERKVYYFDSDQDLIVYKPSQSTLSPSWKNANFVTRVIDYDFATEDYLYKLLPDGIASVSGELFILHKDVVIPNKVQYQGQELTVRSIEDGAFDTRRDLKSVDLNDIRTIGNYSFANCDSLKIVNMENVEYIKNDAFKNTHRIETINSGATLPPFIADKSVFEHAVYINSKVFVPVGCKEAYQKDSIWSNFFSIGESSDITISRFALTVESNVGGTVHVKDSLLQQQKYEAFVKNGEEIVVTLTPDECFVLDSIRVNGKDVFEDVVNNVYTFTMSKNIDLEVVFKREVLHIDDAKDTYKDVSDVVLKELTYTRYFEDTEWQPLYVPFVMNYEDWADRFDVARLNNVHQYDVDNDGTFERTDLEVVRVGNGQIVPNTPYLIRAKSTGSHTISLSDVILKSAKINSVDCSSLCHLYTFTGTYEALPGNVLNENNLYTVINGELTNENQNSLGAFRWYLSITNRGEHKFTASRIRIVEVDEVTGIEENHMNPVQFKVYDLEGRLVKDNATDIQGLQPGIYIINGQKVMVK